MFPENRLLLEAMPTVAACACSYHSRVAVERFHGQGILNPAVERLHGHYPQKPTRRVACPCRDSAQRLHLGGDRERALFLSTFSLERSGVLVELTYDRHRLWRRIVLRKGSWWLYNILAVTCLDRAISITLKIRSQTRARRRVSYTGNPDKLGRDLVRFMVARIQRGVT